MRWFLIGVFSACAIALIAGFISLRQARGFSTREQPTPGERWMARQARTLAMPVDAKARINPVMDTPEAIAEGSAHWADHCFSCHANDGSGDTILGKSLYPPAPDMRLAATQQLTDGELFYVIQNGIRLTGMPAWGTGSARDEEDSWKLVRLIRHLPQLTLEEKKSMEKLNPRSPDELREEQEEERFLKGDDRNDNTNEPEPQHHHH